MEFETLVQNKSAEVIGKLVKDVLDKDPVTIHFDYADNDQWSVITTHQYEDDTQISLRLHQEDFYDLYIGYYDDEDEFNEVVHPLTNEEKKIVPDKLKKLMKKVLDDEEGVRVPAKLLSK